MKIKKYHWSNWDHKYRNYQLICNEDIFLSCDPETPAENFNSGNDIIRFYKDFNLVMRKTLFIYSQSRDSVNAY